MIKNIVHKFTIYFNKFWTFLNYISLKAIRNIFYKINFKFSSIILSFILTCIIK